MILFTFGSQSIAISFNGKKQEATATHIAGLVTFEIALGACRKTHFLNTDVSPMSLKKSKFLMRKGDLSETGNCRNTIKTWFMMK